MRFTWDHAKNSRNISERGLDFAHAVVLWNAPMLVWTDTRRDYGEKRELGLGVLNGRVMAVGWVRRADDHIHLFSFRKANARETRRYKESLPTEPTDAG
jgi:uncharacterized DUF497 family protein